jgi:chaperonin GroEL
LAFLAINNHNKAIRVCVTIAPAFREERRIEMEDIALLTGGTYVSDIRGVDIKEIELENLGSARKCIVSKEETIIIGGIHDGEGLESLLNELRMNLAQAKNEEERFPIEKRIAKLTGGVAVIQVGAATETEMKEKLDRFDDAVRSTKAAIAEGFVAGGGTAFIRISQKLWKQKSIIDDDRDKGEYLIQRILTTPLRQMAQNSGVDPDLIQEQVLKAKGNIGYNTKTGHIEDLVECGIIDSTKALRCALINAASIAGMLIISECLIEAVA